MCYRPVLCRDPIRHADGGAMAIILCHNTALELLRARPPQIYPLVRTAAPLSLAEGGTNYRELHRCDLASLGVTSRQVHVLVASGRRVADARNVRTHRCRLEEVPAGLLHVLAPGVYASSPELLFVQMARRLSPTAAVVLAEELCGSYSRFPQMISGFYDRPVLTSRPAIRAACDQLHGLYGMGRAAAALDFVLDRAASPMETVLACSLALPPSLGGQGFVPPRLNHGVVLGEAARRMTGARLCRVDLAWPDARLGLEYDSDEFHHSPAADRARREALAHMGWTVYTVDLAQMRRHGELLRTVSLLAGSVPRMGGAEAPTHEASRALHQRLLKATRYGGGPRGGPVSRSREEGVGEVPRLLYAVRRRYRRKALKTFSQLAHADEAVL